MEPPRSAPVPGANGPVPYPNEIGALRSLAAAIRTRIIAGLLLALPIALTFWILYWLYSTVQAMVVTPMTRVYDRFVQTPPPWWGQWAAPPIAVALLLVVLYVLGLLVRSSLLSALDWVLLRVPVVTTIYKALRNVSQSVASQMQNQKYQRVVLVEFPHPGARALAFVTNTLQDVKTGRTILCVCVLTGVMPPSGFTLYVPEESVTEVDWSVNQCLQAILSGGMTSPASIHYHNGLHAAAAAGPIVDPHGKPIETEREVPEGVEG
jgi:uncharacterized membrane protein